MVANQATETVRLLSTLSESSSSMKLVISCLIFLVIFVVGISLMSLLVKQAEISGEGARATERGSSAIVDGRCVEGYTSAPVDLVQNKIEINSCMCKLNS